jgi:hypothetical protein
MKWLRANTIPWVEGRVVDHFQITIRAKNTSVPKYKYKENITPRDKEDTQKRQDVIHLNISQRKKVISGEWSYFYLQSGRQRNLYATSEGRN